MTIKQKSLGKVSVRLQLFISGYTVSAEGRGVKRWEVIWKGQVGKEGNGV